MEDDKQTGNSKETRDPKEKPTEDENAERNDEESRSGSYLSRTNSYRSDMSQDIEADNVPRRNTNNHHARKATAKRRLKARHGRVQKKRQHFRPRRRAHRPKPVKRERHISLASIVTRNMSSVDSERCKFCGHRLSRRRYEKQRRRVTKKRVRRVRFKKELPRYKKKRVLALDTKVIQVGEQSAVLSPLFVKTNSTITDGQPGEMETSCSYCEITPDMISKTITKLTKWRETVASLVILAELKRCYPVQTDTEKLHEELVEKLNVAAIVGIVTAHPNDHWGPQCDIQARQLTDSQVTQFWKIYLDTMKALPRKKQIT